ncbi:MAG: Plasmid stabilization system [Rubritepida sp.]|nr:Plasmid stabilization system [Rubritepida sp.]
MRRLLDAALEDLLDIQTHLTRESTSAVLGRGFAQTLYRQCVKLASMPGMLGRPRPELRRDFRSFAFKGYVIFFRYEADTLEVVNILEGHRDIVAHFQDDDI